MTGTSATGSPSRPRDLHLHLAGVGDGYNLPVDLTYWHDDDSQEFAQMWTRTADGPLTETG